MRTKRNWKILLVFCALSQALFWTALLCGFTNTIDTATPLGTDPPSVIDDRIRQAKAGWQERLDVDHYFPLTSTQVSDSNAGEHRYVHFHGPNTTPAAIAANEARLYTKDVGGIAELHWIDENEDEAQLTSGGATAIGHLLSAHTSDANLAASDLTGNYTHTNTGASAVVTLSLVAGAANYKGTFVVTDTDGLRINPNGSETFVDFTQSSAAGKYISSSTVGSSVTILWNNASTGQWQIKDQVGIWDIED